MDMLHGLDVNRGDYPLNLPADIPIRFVVCSGLTNANRPPPDEMMAEGLRTVMDRVYGNFIDTVWTRNDGFVGSHGGGIDNLLTTGTPYYEYIFNLPMPSSWRQLDLLEVVIANVAEWFLDNEYTAWPYIRWREIEHTIDPAIPLS